MSDDGRHALTLIAFIGSVFSPYYARARRAAARAGPAGADPRDHCAFNVALYPGPAARDGRPARRWSMTERGRRQLHAEAEHLAIGPSSLGWAGDALTWQIDEVGAPWPHRLRGRVRLHPLALTSTAFALDADGRHRWWPIAPLARVEVAFDSPAVRWQGHAYLDANQGDAPLEDDFVRWDWARGRLGGPADATRCAIVYDIERRRGAPLALSLSFDVAHGLQPLEAPARVPLAAGRWGVARGTRHEAASGGTARVLHTLEDGPFYNRSLIQARWAGQPVTAVHESLSLERFSRPWVQALLPFRMPRRTG